MKTICLSILLFFISIANIVSQSDQKIERQRIHLSLGSKHAGLGFGGFTKYNGIDLGFTNNSDSINGIAIELFNVKGRCNLNGLGVGIVGSNVANLNGINVGLFTAVVRKKMNGINFSLLTTKIEKGNGIVFSSFANLTQHVNGISASFYTNNIKSSNGLAIGGIFNLGKSNGVSLGGIFNGSDSYSNGLSISFVANSFARSNGVMIAPFNFIIKQGKGLQIGVYNTAGSFKGIQLGLINRIKENKSPFKVLPFINFNFKKSFPETPKVFELYSDSMIDERNGRVYKTITINKTTWMAENLNIVNSSIDGICYENDLENCKTYGVLYKSDIALKVCPVGWHLPSIIEFDTLLANLGWDEDKVYVALIKGGASRFNALLGGSGFSTLSGKNKVPEFNNIESNGYYWSSTEVERDLKYLYILELSDDPSVTFNWGRKNDVAYSVRCVKD